ncbi:DoxX family protein [Roseomonas sp. OT10]|uniref:DoxX family protein n=1 Tax=Roseomonas cutis TaxID=2897332 RepID=UPI001E2FEB62|nr:DoxX family protein [Roseomonas sp. OT10]UFN49360.1 DoxX family protein [Roseomonas sp. OT10]
MSDIALHANAVQARAQARPGVPAMTMLRVLLGLFYLPHFYSKVVGFESTSVFFAKAGFHPPGFFVAFSAAAELAVAVALILGLFTRYAALVSFVLMVVAAYAIIQVKGLGWYWSGGGIEYLVMWGLASLVVFVHAWREEPGLLGFGRNIRL